jgi:hypothetical protein
MKRGVFENNQNQTKKIIKILNLGGFIFLDKSILIFFLYFFFKMKCGGFENNQNQTKKIIKIFL